MIFSGIAFIYVFLPCVTAVYFAVPKKLKNSVLLLSGLVFYAWGEPKYVFLMIFAILLNYICGLVIGRNISGRTAKVTLAFSVTANLSMLGYFKYAGFFTENSNRLFGTDTAVLKIALPVGISFYTFQILSYVVDVYRGDVPPQRNIITFGAYVVMFPQLVAGPIVRYSDINNALVSRTHTLQKASDGVRRFAVGLAKKVIIADSFGVLCESFKRSDDMSMAFYWLYAVSFTLQIYYDFSGYSDMAVGLGKIFGFDFPENFDYPYISRSVTEFWRRWHRSLGTWFKDYLYIPLGGSRTTPLKRIRNILIVWLATGFWHGAEWNFLLWGLYFAVLLIIEKVWLYKKLEKSVLLSRIYLLFIVVIGFVIFNAESMSEISENMSAMFGAGNIPFVSDSFFYYLKSYGVLLITAIVGSTPVVKKYAVKISNHSISVVAEPVFVSVLLIVCTAFIADSSFSPFLYFRF